MKLQVGVKALLIQGNKYLFLRRSTSFKTGTQKWDIPGGRIEVGETLYDALRREIYEETALELVDVDSLLAAQDIFATEKDLHVVRVTYLAEAKGTIKISDEHDLYKWMDLQEILSDPNVDSYLRKVLENL